MGLNILRTLSTEVMGIKQRRRDQGRATEISEIAGFADRADSLVVSRANLMETIGLEKRFSDRDLQNTPDSHLRFTDITTNSPHSPTPPTHPNEPLHPQEREAQFIQHAHTVIHQELARREVNRQAQSTRADTKRKKSVQFQAAYPTAGRERQKIKEKERKAAGIDVVKKKQQIEDHHDDCGNDLTGLGPDISLLASDISIEYDDYNDDYDGCYLVQNLALWWLHGSYWEADLGPQHCATIICSNFHITLQYLASKGIGIDIIELCGGAARTSTVCIRRNLQAGPNFDIICQCDLNDVDQQLAVLQYIRRYRPLVAVMAPTCTPFGPMASFNYQVNYDTWLKSYNDAVPHGRFCGKVALLMIEINRYFMNEQPDPSWLYHEYPWPRVLKHPSVQSELIHQCMTGQKGPNGLPAKKPTRFVSNSRLLLVPLETFKCDGQHQHDSLEARGGEACKLWTWTLANAITDGIILLKRFITDPDLFNAYPSIATGTDGEDPSRAQASQAEGDNLAEEAWRQCPGCKGRMNKRHPAHNRTPGVCKHPLVEPWQHNCPGCIASKPSGDSSHNYMPGSCRWYSTQNRSGKARTGHHPRAPRVRASASPTADLQAQLPDGTDLGAGDEAQAAASGPSSSSSAAPAPVPAPAVPAPDETEAEPAAPRAVRGPDQGERVRRTFADQATGTPNQSD